MLLIYKSFNQNHTISTLLTYYVNPLKLVSQIKRSEFSNKNYVVIFSTNLAKTELVIYHNTFLLG